MLHIEHGPSLRHRNLYLLVVIHQAHVERVVRAQVVGFACRKLVADEAFHLVGRFIE